MAEEEGATAEFQRREGAERADNGRCRDDRLQLEAWRKDFASWALTAAMVYRGRAKRATAVGPSGKVIPLGKQALDHI